MAVDFEKRLAKIEDFWPDSLSQTLDEIVSSHLWTGALVVFPFCEALLPIMAFYKADGKVLACNPDALPLLVAETAMATVSPDALQRAFNDLGNSRKSGKSLHHHLATLYQIACPICQTHVSADYFVWRRDAADPEQSYARCETCGFADETSVTQTDLHHLDQIETRGVHYHFLLGRTFAPQAETDRPVRTKLEALHDLYTPRALYAIAEILMKLEATILNRDLQRLLKGLFFRCLLPTSMLFGPQQTIKMPKRLRPPTKFVEYNVWRLFEASVAAWAPAKSPPRQMRRIADFLPAHHNSVLFFPDHAAQLTKYLTAETIALVLAAPPTPDPIRQALSTLWGGWLLGLKVAEMTHPWLARRGPDWLWYQRHLSQPLRALRVCLKPDAFWHFTFSPHHRLHAPSIILAALQAGYEVDEWTITTDYHHLRLVLPDTTPDFFHPADSLPTRTQAEIRDVIRSFAQRPPQTKDQGYWLVWQSLLYSGLLQQIVEAMPEAQVLRWVDGVIRTHGG